MNFTNLPYLPYLPYLPSETAETTELFDSKVVQSLVKLYSKSKSPMV